MSYSAAVYIFSVNESTIYIEMSLNRNTHKTRLYIDQLIKTLWPDTHKNLILYFSLEKKWFKIQQFSVYRNFIEHNYCKTTIDCYCFNSILYVICPLFFFLLSLFSFAYFLLVYISILIYYGILNSIILLLGLRISFPCFFLYSFNFFRKSSISFFVY